MKHNFKVGDKIKIADNGLQLHSRSIPAHIGYNQAMIDWRKQLHDIQKSGSIGTVELVFENSETINIDFDGRLFGVYKYMITKVEEV